MSAKLLYALSDDNQKLGKQIGCVNGFLQFFDRGRTIHRRLPPSEGSERQRDGNASGRRSKEKHHNVAKEVQRNNVEPSRASISSSTGSTTMSSLEYDPTIKSERSPFYETTSSETNSWDSKVNQPHFSPYRSNPSKETMTNQLDSPRFLHPLKLDSPRLTSRNESFRSVSSNQSAPVTPLRKKDASRMSYDGTETREKFVTSLKFDDLPRLSLDSKQRTINKSVSGTRKDLHLTDQPEEPGSYRPPSNIVVKLMGLENLPDYTPTHKNHIESDRFSGCGRFDSLSTSSRTTDEGQLIRVLDSPRNNSESRTPRLRKEPAARKSQDGNPDGGRTAAKCWEVQAKSPNKSLTLYGEIERKLADLDFKKSGKDLRALKQILEAIHREKTMNGAKKENHSSDCLAEMSINSSSRQTKSPQKGQMPRKSEVSKHPQDVKSRTTKSAQPVRDSATRGASKKHNVSLPRLNQQRCNQPAANVLDSVDEKATKTCRSLEPTSQTLSITSRDLGETTPRPIRTSKATEHVTKGTFTSSVRISGSTKMYRRNRVSENQIHAPVTTLITRTKLQHQQTVEPRPQNQQLQSKSSILQNSNVDFSDLPAQRACPSHQRNSRYLLIDDGSFCQADNKSPERIKGDQSFAELHIDMKEQPSPVSVLDAKFYDDESPSPVKKKPTFFTAYDDSTSTTTENELKDIDITYSPYSIRLGFSCDSDHPRREMFVQSGHAPRKLSSNQGGNSTSSITPQKDIKLETEYVRDILLASGFLDDPNFTEVNHSVYHWKGTLNPNLFYVLEQTRGNRLLSHNTGSKTMKRPYDMHRRLVFDVVNEILTNKLPSIGMGRQLHLVLNRLSGSKNGEQLLREILKEVDGLQANNFLQSLDEEQTFLTSIIERDLMHRSANWAESNSEISGLVLDIERLIFKDLISELVYEETPHSQSQR